MRMDSIRKQWSHILDYRTISDDENRGDGEGGGFSVVNDEPEIDVRRVREERASLIDLIRWDKVESKRNQIKTIIGVDFSSSNRSPSVADGLHRDIARLVGDADELPRNMYEGAIKTIYERMVHYDRERTIEMHGLCAEVSGIFYPSWPLDEASAGGRGTEGGGLERLLRLYREAKESVQFSGPTTFAEFLRATAQRVRNATTCYYVVFVLTDGGNADMDELARIVCEIGRPDHPESCQNISLVFVKIGDEKIGRGLETLDEDVRSLVRGVHPLSDIVKYVEFHEEYLAYPGEFHRAFEGIPRGFKEWAAKQRMRET